MRNKTWVAIFFVVAAIIIGLVAGIALGTLFAALRISDAPVLGDRVTVTRLLGFALAALIAVGCFMWQKTNNFMTHVVDELNKVNWPSWGETKVNTAVVIITSVIAALILGVFDISFGFGSDWLATRF